MPPFNWMDEQPRVDAQSRSDILPNQASMQPPVPGTVSRGHLDEALGILADTNQANIPNPLPSDEKTLALGREKFDTYCSPCHGYLANGDSRLHGQFPNPPSLHSEKVRTWQDGRLFHVITYGQNIMPSYSKQTTPEERWAIAHYIRVLQRAENAKAEDLK